MANDTPTPTDSAVSQMTQAAYTAPMNQTQSPDIAQPSPAPGAPAAPPAAPPAAAPPDPQPPPQRGGLAGILDSVADLLAPKQQHIDIDPNTSEKTVTAVPQSRGRQWANIGLEALTGAGRVLSAGTGPQNQVKGVGSAISGSVQDQKNQNDQDEGDAETRAADQQKAKLQQINYQILSRKLAADTITQYQNGVRFNDEQMKFADAQEDREKALGSYDLGSVSSAAHIADLANGDPQFIDKIHRGDIVPVPTYDPTTGAVNGVHVYERKPNANQQKFTGQIHMFTPGAKPGDPPKFTLYTPTNLNVGEATTADMAAAKNMNDWQAAQQKIADDKTNQGLHKAETARAYAGANESNAKAEESRANASATSQNSHYVEGQNPTLDDTAEGLASGRLQTTDLSKRAGGKGQPTLTDTYAAANAYSIKHFGLPYNPTIIAQEASFAKNTKTQAYLDGVEKTTGAHGEVGQLDQLMNLAKQAGLGPNAPINDVSLAIKNKLGDKAAKNFLSLLSETQRNLGTLIGNPLLGGGESDKKLQQAKEAFGEHATLDNLTGQIGVIKGVLGSSVGVMAKNNRYIQQRYGTQLSPQGQPTQAPAAQPAANTSQAAHAPAAAPVTITPGEPTITFADGSKGVNRGGQWVKAAAQ